MAIIDDRKVSLPHKVISLCGDGWLEQLYDVFKRPYMTEISKGIVERRKVVKVYPSTENVFRAFRETPYKKVKVVILGQDPYHDGSANGLAFSSSGMYNPPSLKMIFKEMKETIPNFNINRDGDLIDWAHQGVLLLNTILTVDQGKPMSHATFGWKQFTTEVIIQLNKHPIPLVFILWGKEAKSYAYLIDKKFHYVETGNHPASEFHSEGSFLGGNYFKRVNEQLIKTYGSTIKW